MFPISFTTELSISSSSVDIKISMITGLNDKYTNYSNITMHTINNLLHNNDVKQYLIIIKKSNNLRVLIIHT